MVRRADSYVMMSTGHLNLTAKYANINNNVVRQRQLAWYALYFQVRIFRAAAKKKVSAESLLLLAPAIQESYEPSPKMPP